MTDWRDIQTLLSALADARWHLDYSRAHSPIFDEIRQARYDRALAAVAPYVDMLRPGDAIECGRAVVLRLDFGAALVVPTVSLQDLAKRYDAAQPAAPDPAADAVMTAMANSFTPPVERFHE